VASARRAIARRRGHRALAALGLAGSGIRNGSEVAAAALGGAGYTGCIDGSNSVECTLVCTLLYVCTTLYMLLRPYPGESRVTPGYYLDYRPIAKFSRTSSVYTAKIQKNITAYFHSV
jgi:hypothetical protein